jgi:hypothetical protein
MDVGVTCGVHSCACTCVTSACPRGGGFKGSCVVAPTASRCGVRKSSLLRIRDSRCRSSRGSTISPKHTFGTSSSPSMSKDLRRWSPGTASDGLRSSPRSSGASSSRRRCAHLTFSASPTNAGRCPSCATSSFARRSSNRSLWLLGYRTLQRPTSRGNAAIGLVTRMWRNPENG